MRKPFKAASTDTSSKKLYDIPDEKLEIFPTPDKGLSPRPASFVLMPTNKIMQKEDTDIFYPKSVDEWRQWLADNHQSKSAVWVVQHHKVSGKPTISWSEAVSVALCYGWIDSKKIAVGEGTTHQFFTKRKAKSTWSKINKDKVAQLIEDGLMTKAGFEVIELAKQNGSWSLLDEVEALKIPEDLNRAFASRAGSKDFFLSLSRSSKKNILYWVISAKRPETRHKRIEEIAELAAQGKKPKQF